MEALGLDASWKLVLVVIALVITTVLSIVALRVRFDINRWQENRQKQQEKKLKALCTHTSIDWANRGNSLAVTSYFMSPSMTAMWICSRCGTQTLDPYTPTRILSFWGEHPEEWLKQEKKFTNLARRLGFI